MLCPICANRKPQRFCPAKGETICAVCCGTEREVTIDCPSDCTYLQRARRQDAANRKPMSWKDLPLSDVRIPPDFVDEHRELIAALSLSLLEFARHNAVLHDADVAEALAALAGTYRTLTSGLYYENPPAGGIPRALYSHIAQFLEKLKKERAEAAGFPAVKDSEIFHMLVFFLRFEKSFTTGRPRSRAFLDYVREHFPSAKEAEDAPRIVLP
jgi:hypothetical protein